MLHPISWAKKTAPRALIVFLFALLFAILTACAAIPASPPILTAVPSETPVVQTPAQASDTPTPFPPTSPPPTPTPTSTPALPSLTLAGHTGGQLTAQVIDGDIAYLAIGSRLVVLELSSDAGPHTLFTSEPQPYTAADLALDENLLYWLTSRSSLRLFDISNPAAPILVGEVAIPSDMQAIVAQDNYLYLVENLPPGDRKDALRIYDNSEPFDPLELGQHSLSSQGIELDVIDDRAYVRVWNGSLEIIDLSNPAAPRLLYTLTDLSGAYFYPPYLYTTGMDNLLVYDLSAADEPHQLVAWPLEREPRVYSVFAGAIYQNYLYLFDNSAPPCGGDVSPSCQVSFHVLDITDPAQPQSLVGPLENQQFDFANRAQVQGQQLFVSDRNGLHAFSLSDPLHPAPLWEYPIATTIMEAYDISVQNGFLYLGTDLLNNSLYAFDLRDLSNPTLSGPFTPPIATNSLAAGDNLYLALGPSGLSVMDISQPASPVEIARLDDEVVTLGGDLNRPLAAISETLYLSVGYAGLAIVDIFDPTAPRTLGLFDTGGGSFDMAIAFGYLYVLTGNALNVVDISAPHAPQITNHLELPAASRLTISGELALVSSRMCLGDNTGGLALISLSDPAHPALLSIADDAPCGIIDVASLGSYAILAAGSSGILAVDISNPAAPFLAASLRTPSLATRVVVEGGLIYALDELAGIYVLRLVPE